MGSGELWFCLTISVVMWPQSPQSPAQISPPTQWPHWGTHVAPTVSHADTRHKKLVLKLFLIIFESYPLQEIVDRCFSRSLLIDKIGSSDDKISLIPDICYQGSASILIVFWAPCFLFRSVICRNIRSTQHYWSAFQGRGEKLILRADYHFCPAGLYFVIMIFLVHNIDRCSASNSPVSWCDCRKFSLSRKKSWTCQV